MPLDTGPQNDVQKDFNEVPATDKLEQEKLKKISQIKTKYPDSLKEEKSSILQGLEYKAENEEKINECLKNLKIPSKAMVAFVGTVGTVENDDLCEMAVFSIRGSFPILAIREAPNGEVIKKSYGNDPESLKLDLSSSQLEFGGLRFHINSTSQLMLDDGEDDTIIDTLAKNPSFLYKK